MLELQESATMLLCWKNRKEANEKNEKRKSHEEVRHLKAKKKRAEDKIKCLHESADNLVKKSESQNEMTLLTQSNSLQNTAHAKEKCLKQVEKLLEDKLQELKDL